MTGIFREMRGLPVTIRLLDPPLHEFLPNLTDLTVQAEHARREGHRNPELDAQLARVQALHELNPMLGTRGVRLGLEIADLDEFVSKNVTEILRRPAVVEALKTGSDPNPETRNPKPETRNPNPKLKTLEAGA